MNGRLRGRGSVRGRWTRGRGSVRARLTLWNVGVLALTLAVLGAALLGILRANIFGSVDRDEAHFAGVLQRQFQDAAFPAVLTGTGRDTPRRPYGPRFLDVNGLPMAPFAAGPAWDAGTFPASLRGATVYSTVHIRGVPVRVLSVPLRRGGRVVGVAQVARSLSDENRQMRRVTAALLTLLPLALLIAGAGGAFLANRALRPIRDITHAAARMEAEALSERLPVTGDDELAELASTFNGMLARLEHAFARQQQLIEQQRQFTADASHELRTPLTAIKAHTSLALMEPRTGDDRPALEAIDRAADRTVRLVQDLLLLARADAGQIIVSPAPCSVRDVLRQAREAVTGPSAPVVVEPVDPSLSVCGDTDALARLFGNLLTNAARHTPPEGTITINAHAVAGNVVVRVRDTGEGIPAQHLPHLGERFYRVDAARASAQGGTGLGLSICRSIAEAHGGKLTIESAVGVGTTVTVTLPRT